MSLFPEKYSGLNSLYKYVKSSEISEIGSSSISPEFAQSCAEVRKLMATTCFIGQINADMNAAWEALGDKSGVLYFGGRKSDGRRVGSDEYLECLALVLDGLSEKAATELDTIAASLAELPNITPSGPVHGHDKRGAYIIPPEVFKRNMTDEEIEPYRVEAGDPRLDEW